MPLRLILALAFSLVLHGSLLFPDAVRDTATPPRPALRAFLRPPPAASLPASDPLLKNTLDAEQPREKITPPPLPLPQKPAKMARPATAKQAVKVAQKKLSQHLYYPPEAIQRGIEGEVRLLITLAADGRIVEVSIAASSGHRLLDNAALKAAYAIGNLSGTETRELILPVIFRLQ